MDKVVVYADNRKEAFKKARKKVYYDGNVKIPVVVLKAKPHPLRRGQYIVTIRRNKRYI